MLQNIWQKSVENLAFKKIAMRGIKSVGKQNENILITIFYSYDWVTFLIFFEFCLKVTLYSRNLEFSNILLIK